MSSFSPLLVIHPRYRRGADHTGVVAQHGCHHFELFDRGLARAHRNRHAVVYAIAVPNRLEKRVGEAEICQVLLDQRLAAEVHAIDRRFLHVIPHVSDCIVLRMRRDWRFGWPCLIWRGVRAETSAKTYGQS